jgi:hypothetical protein
MYSRGDYLQDGERANSQKALHPLSLWERVRVRGL